MLLENGNIKYNKIERDKDSYKIVEQTLAKINRYLPILNKGYVEIEDILGHDFIPVQTQRISYNLDLKNNFERDYGLLKKLLKLKHLVPFEHVVLRFKLKIPIFVQRQLVKYRISSWSELSSRYTLSQKSDYYIPTRNRLELLEKEENESVDLIKKFNNFYQHIDSIYSRLVEEEKLPYELQRIIQPVQKYTTVYWTLNLRELFHMLEQRLDQHQQYETREVQKQIYFLSNKVLPLNMELFKISHSTFFDKEMHL